jgi:uncharacterized membrane protein YeaQ/YmgE (transglycosylase-associated protein family)
MFELITDVISWIISAPFILIGWIIVGAIAGELARRFTGDHDESFFADLGLGILGAIIGGFIAGIVGIGLPGGGIPLLIANLVIATFGAAVLIMIKRAFTGGNQRVNAS